MLGRFFQLSLERVLGAVAGLGEIAVGAVLHGVGVTVTELVCHGVVAALAAFVRLLGSFPAIGIVVKMVADARGHGGPFEMHVSIIMTTGSGYPESSRRAMLCGVFPHNLY
jgi:hypothetical protein